MAWRQTGDKPLPEPMLTHSTDTYAALGGDEWTKMTSYVLQVSRQLGSLMDLYTTFINMAGKQIPSDRVVDGIDLTSVLFSQKQTDRLVCCTI